MYFRDYRDLDYNNAEQHCVVFVLIPEPIIAVTAAVAACLLANHPEGTADETAQNVSLNSEAIEFIRIQHFQKISAEWSANVLNYYFFNLLFKIIPQHCSIVLNTSNSLA